MLRFSKLKKKEMRLSQYFSLVITFHTMLTKTMAMTTSISRPLAKNFASKLITIPEDIWRHEAAQHRDRIWCLLQPGLVPPSSTQSQSRRNRSRSMLLPPSSLAGEWTKLDPNNPIFNFLIEYYGLKGAKGVKRLARWSPDPSLLLLNDEGGCHDGIRIQTGRNKCDEVIIEAAMKASHNLGGIFLENATEDDIGQTLHLRGATIVATPKSNLMNDLKFHGVLYNPALFYNDPVSTREQHQQLLKTIAPFQWYSSILERTLNSEPILHCHGLHEW